MAVAKEPSFDNALAFAADLVRLPGLSGREGDVARRVREELDALGFSGVRVDEVGNVVGVAPGRGEAPPVMLSSHLDVVAEGDASEWEFPPFSGEITGGFLHGRGAMDIKGPLALQTYAAASLIGSAPGDVIVAHTVFEERGGLGMRHLMASGSVAPAAVVIGEATRGDVCIGHRGRAELEVAIQGRAGHASRPDRAANAIELLGPVLDAVREVAGDPGRDEVLGPESLVATMVDVLPESRNVIPDSVVVALDWRVLPGAEESALHARVEEAIRRRISRPREGLSWSVRTATQRQRTYTGVETDWRLLSHGFLMPADDPIVAAAAAAVGRRDGSDGPAEIRPWAFATDGGWTRGVHGIPTIGFAPGDESHAHTNRERLDVEDARWAFARYPELVCALQRAAGG